MGNQTDSRRRGGHRIARRALAPAISMLAMGAVSNAARADEILVFQVQAGDATDVAGAQAETVLEGLGHSVTLVASSNPTLPDLTPFDTIYITQSVAITVVQGQALRDAMVAGKGVLFTGESSPAGDNASSLLQNLFTGSLNDVVQFGSNLNPGNALVFPATAGGGITSTPNVLTGLTAGGPGPIGAELAPKNTLLEDGGGLHAGAIFPPEDLRQMSGCALVVMDLDWWLPGVNTTQVREDVVENFQTFLSTCADADDDGVSDQQETASGTGVSDADSDDDGLCDGYGTGNGTCIPGDGIYEDADMDGTIDPLDADDDDDGVPTSFEAPLEGMYPDLDGDGIPTWEDLDSDEDGVDDEIEGTGDYNGNGIPAIVENGDVPMQCASDDECGGANSGVVCDDASGYCIAGCRGDGGNGCPDGETCTSTDGSIGDCVPDGEGGGGMGGAGPTSSGSTSGATNGAGPSSTSAGGTGAGTGGAGADDSGSDDGDDGCGCTVPQSGSGTGALIALVAAGVAALRRRRRS